uniref:p-aminobenzoic acid synthase n=1 Tax=Spongospora subterranea TaxID=70186 RepID=A0A0H5QPL9_9EUKA|eukprot:CRZ03306.1 hypothetical protein [Spongospora subterranea]
MRCSPANSPSTVSHQPCVAAAADQPSKMKDAFETFTTAGGVEIRRRVHSADYTDGIVPYVDMLHERRGAVFSSSYEYPGRYERWDIAFVDPPVSITCRRRDIVLNALNERGRILLPTFASVLALCDAISSLDHEEDQIRVSIIDVTAVPFSEEQRTRQPSVFSALRAILAYFKTERDDNLGLWGAFGYDLAFQFEPIDFKLSRPDDSRDLVLYFPDEILVVDHYKSVANRYSYEFSVSHRTTDGLQRSGQREPYLPTGANPGRGDHEPGEYAKVAAKAIDYFRRGDLFEVVPGQTFYAPATASPSAIFHRLKATNPSPFGFMINLGKQEYLVGASPEMFVRVTNGTRVETCPISGTIGRGKNAIEDSAQILALLNSTKDESELTMCSDVDRNDKSRVCEPGSVRVIGRRQIEMYSRLIHTVDHIDGRLRDDMDGLDAFISHAWAVTVTGAPKRGAMQFIEDNERSPRSWYAGAVGALLLNGDVNTGMTLRTVRIKDGVGQVRAGATLLFDSDPHAEEAETELKASAMLAAIQTAGTVSSAKRKMNELVGIGRRVVLIDHEDSFVLVLASYIRETGAECVTVRAPRGVGLDMATLDRYNPHLVVIAPGPGSPSDFRCCETIAALRQRRIPIFGVCLGLQALIEAFGGSLGRLEIPVHGKCSEVQLEPQSILFAGLPERIVAGRYHSLYATEVPDCFRVTAKTQHDGIVMAIEHRSERIAAVQFHPESIMSLDAGHRIIENALQALTVQEAA